MNHIQGNIKAAFGMRFSAVIICLFFLLTTVHTFASEIRSIDTSQLEVKLAVTYVKGEGKPFSGKAVSNYVNGRQKNEEYYIDGKRDGLATFWYENGQKEKEENWQGGKKEGVTTLWHANGQKSGDLYFVDGRRQGKHTMWHKNGQKSYEMNYKDGKFDGPFIEWYENGNKKLEATYSSGRKNGTESLWDENGQLIKTMVWREGVLAEEGSSTESK
jgi:antitoxin component YwqK of YwqJK toxin-antitoxin module